MRKLLISLIMVFGCSGAALAYVSGGHSYELSCNAAGYVLTSENVVSRFVEGGAASRIWKKKEVIYMGRSCDAQHELFGSGKWCWANGGFVVEFDQMSFGFLRQELYCQANDSLGIDCRC